MYNVPTGSNVFQIAASARMRAAEAAERLRVEEMNKGRAVLKRRRMPAWAIDIVEKVSIERGVSILDIGGAGRTRHLVAARHEAIYEIMLMKPTLSSCQVGSWFDRDHSAILYAAAKHAMINGLVPVVGYDAKAKLHRNVAYNEKMRIRNGVVE